MTPEKRITAALTKIRMRNPFLGTLGLFVDHKLDADIPTACTDDRKIWYNPDFVNRCSLNELAGVVLHELLHAALMHNSRRENRDAQLWNIAADIVVNGMVLQESWASLPCEPVIDKKLEHLRVEDVYSHLIKQGCEREDLLPDDWCDLSHNKISGDENSTAKTGVDLQAHWKEGWRQAQLIHRMRNNGKLGGNLGRLLEEITVPRVDWRSRLWQFLSSTPNDFSDWDRRHIHNGLYLETLAGESLKAEVCIDTSGSIDGRQLGQFVAELKSILRSYPDVVADLYYADANLAGPFTLDSDDSIPEPVGGGGTSFVPFFEKVGKKPGSTDVIVYLTDGYGVFPRKAPQENVLWVVPGSGLHYEKFPFGEVIRMEAA